MSVQVPGPSRCPMTHPRPLRFFRRALSLLTPFVLLLWAWLALAAPVPAPVPDPGKQPTPPPAAATTPVLVLKGHTKGIFHVTCSPDGKLFATAGKDRCVRV